MLDTLKAIGPTLALIASFFMLINTVRFALTRNYDQKPHPTWYSWVFSPVWLAPLTLVAPTIVGYFLVAELSPLPHVTYQMLIDQSVAPMLAIAVTFVVIVVDLWLLIIPGNLYLWAYPNLLSKQVPIRSTFLILGILLMVPWLSYIM